MINAVIIHCEYFIYNSLQLYFSYWKVPIISCCYCWTHRMIAALAALVHKASFYLSNHQTFNSLSQILLLVLLPKYDHRDRRYFPCHSNCRVLCENIELSWKNFSSRLSTSSSWITLTHSISYRPSRFKKSAVVFNSPPERHILRLFQLRIHLLPLASISFKVNTLRYGSYQIIVNRSDLKNSESGQFRVLYVCLFCGFVCRIIIWQKYISQSRT